MIDNHKATSVCNILREELFENGYLYGFFLNGNKIVPDMSKGVDEEFDRLLKTEYRIQSPAITKREKVATCLDAVLVMKEILCANCIDSKIWMIFQREKKKCHAVLTFVIDGTVVYLELTPQSGKENYGEELFFINQKAFIDYWKEMNYVVQEITDACIIGSKPDFFLHALMK